MDRTFEDQRLILQLQLDDVMQLLDLPQAPTTRNATTAKGKGKASGGERDGEDERMALREFQSSLQDLLQVLNDQRLAASLASAVTSDRATLLSFVKEEKQAEADRELAYKLSSSRLRPSHSQEKLRKYAVGLPGEEEVLSRREKFSFSEGAFENDRGTTVGTLHGQFRSVCFIIKSLWVSSFTCFRKQGARLPQPDLGQRRAHFGL